jgi:hypothetical protein
VMKGLAEFDAIVDMWIAQMQGVMSQMR